MVQFSRPGYVIKTVGAGLVGGIEVKVVVSGGLIVGIEMGVAVAARVGFAITEGMDVGGTVPPGVQAASVTTSRQVNSKARQVLNGFLWFIGYSSSGGLCIFYTMPLVTNCALMLIKKRNL